MSHPDIVEGVNCASWVIYKAVSSIVTLGEGHPQLGVNVFHELSSIVHCLGHRVHNTHLLLQSLKAQKQTLYSLERISSHGNKDLRTNLEQDEDEEELVDDTDTEPKPPVSYGQSKSALETLSE